jgi:hypothetical protein
MLFWEALNASRVARIQNADKLDEVEKITLETARLRYDTRCLAKTKSGRRCRGKIWPGSEYCLFHDPTMIAERRSQLASQSAQRKKRLSHVPDGYLRKLNSLAAVGEAMDRLYREVRNGTVTPEMGEVLFRILTRLMDSDLVKSGPHPERSRAARVRPKLKEILTRSERIAWNRAVAHAENGTNGAGESSSKKPARVIKPSFEQVVAQRSVPRAAVPGPLSFPAAS